MRPDVDPRLIRVLHGAMGSPPSWRLTGAFHVLGPCGAELAIVASDAMIPEAQGWEHVSVSTRRRCPNWEEMCFVKDLFWTPEECVFQLHPPKADWVNNHPYCLHLWRHIRQEPPRPPMFMVGDQALGTLEAG